MDIYEDIRVRNRRDPLLHQVGIHPIQVAYRACLMAASSQIWVAESRLYQAALPHADEAAAPVTVTVSAKELASYFTDPLGGPCAQIAAERTVAGSGSGPFRCMCASHVDATQAPLVWPSTAQQARELVRICGVGCAEGAETDTGAVDTDSTENEQQEPVGSCALHRLKAWQRIMYCGEKPHFEGAESKKKNGAV